MVEELIQKVNKITNITSQDLAAGIPEIFLKALLDVGLG